MRLRIFIKGWVRRSVGPSVPCYFWKTKILDFVNGKFSNDISNNATMSDDEVVTSYGPPRSLFPIRNLCILFHLICWFLNLHRERRQTNRQTRKDWQRYRYKDTWTDEQTDRWMIGLTKGRIFCPKSIICNIFLTFGLRGPVDPERRQIKVCRFYHRFAFLM